MQNCKGQSSEKLLSRSIQMLQEPMFEKVSVARGFFVASFGNSADEMNLECIDSYNDAKEDKEFRIENRSGFSRLLNLSALSR